MHPKNNKNQKKSKGTSARKPPPPAAVEGKEAEEQDATSTPERPPSPRDSAGDACQSDSSLSDHSKQSSVESINIQAYERISVPQLLSMVMETIEDHPEFATYAVEAKELIDREYLPPMPSKSTWVQRFSSARCLFSISLTMELFHVD